MAENKPEEISVFDLNRDSVLEKLLNELRIGTMTQLRKYSIVRVMGSRWIANPDGSLSVEGHAYVSNTTPNDFPTKVVVGVDAEDKEEFSRRYRAEGSDYLSSLVLDNIRNRVDNKRINGIELRVMSMQDIVRAVEMGGQSILREQGLNDKAAQTLMQCFSRETETNHQLDRALVVFYHAVQQNHK